MWNKMKNRDERMTIVSKIFTTIFTTIKIDFMFIVVAGIVLLGIALLYNGLGINVNDNYIMLIFLSAGLVTIYYELKPYLYNFEIKANHIPASLSYSAGTFVCNQVMYGVLHHIAKEGLQIKAGFIHIPYMTEQVLDKKNQPSLSLEQLTAGLNAAIVAIINNDEDQVGVSGEIC